ncbi:MAG TPA: hypothetical protein VFN67_34550 [Polyangiales bacterium]|nr:hypothetical protein [Polyangiales bacterium]
MITQLPLEPHRDLYCVPVGPAQRERGWAIGSQIVTITDAVPDDVWHAIAQRFTYLKRGFAKPIVQLLRDRQAVVMFRALDQISENDCTLANVRYYDQLQFPAAAYRNAPPLTKGFNRCRLVKNGRYWREVIEPVDHSWRSVAAALVELNRHVAENMPPSLAIGLEHIAWIKRRNYRDLAAEFDARVRGPA